MSKTPEQAVVDAAHGQEALKELAAHLRQVALIAGQRITEGTSMYLADAALRHRLAHSKLTATEEHDLYKTGDVEAPDAIRDRNGEVALDLCKKCGKAEVELSGPCTLPAQAEPVAWMYHHPGDLEHGWQRYSFERRIQSYEGMSCNEEDAGVIETPLYAAPQPAPDTPHE